jgi:hypothetical protein
MRYRASECTLLGKRPGFVEVGFSNLRRLGRGPFFETHLIDQAQIIDLDVVGEIARFIRIGVEIVTWEILTVPAKI